MTKYIGSQPATSFEAVKKDRFTGLTGTGVTLSHSVSSVQDIVVWVNNVKQDYNNYTVSNTALTLGGSLVSSDVVQVLYVGRTFQTVNPSAASVGNNEVASTIITGQTAETSVATDDLILLSDTSASGALKKMTRANFVSGIGGDNTPAWKMGVSSQQSLAYNTTTKINFDTSIIDTDSGVDTTNKRYTIPSGKGGKYVVHCFYRTGTGTDSASFDIFVYKNGSLLSDAEDMASFTVSQSYNTIQCTGMLDLAAGDYVEMYARQADQNFTFNILYSNEARFWGYKLIGV